MLGDFFREAAVLVTVFFPLELARRDAQGKVSFLLVILICCIVLFSLLMGIALEKWRGQ